MDMITLAMAKKYTDEQRLGYSAYDIASEVHYNGVNEDKEIIPGEALGVSGAYAYASPDVFTGGVPVKVVCVKGGVDLFEASNLRVEVSNDGIWMLLGDIFGENRMLALSFGNNVAQLIGVSAGTYVWREAINDKVCWAGDITGYFTETIHPIDPKFIPGAVLPVVELTTEPTEKGAPLTEAESAMMDEAAAKGMPAVIKYPMGDAMSACIFIYAATEATNRRTFMVGLGASIIQLMNLGEGWVFLMTNG